MRGAYFFVQVKKRHDSFRKEGAVFCVFSGSFLLREKNGKKSGTTIW